MTTEALYTDTAMRAWTLVITQLDQMFSSMNAGAGRLGRPEWQMNEQH